MSYYSKLKPYEEHLERWHRASSWGRHYANEQNEVITIYEEETGLKVNTGCRKCIADCLTKVSNYFVTKKAEFSKRRKGKKKNG